jgi:hypothetical protein
MSKVCFLGLDVHANTISAAVAEPSGEVWSFGVIRNTPFEIWRLLKRLEPGSALRVCYEAGRTGYVPEAEYAAVLASAGYLSITAMPHEFL